MVHLAAYTGCTNGTETAISIQEIQAGSSILTRTTQAFIQFLLTELSSKSIVTVATKLCHSIGTESRMTVNTNTVIDIDGTVCPVETFGADTLVACAMDDADSSIETRS